MKLLILILFFGIISYSICQNEVNVKDLVLVKNVVTTKKDSIPFTGVGISLDKKNNRRSVVNYLEGIRHGKATGYYSNGNIYQEIFYVNGKIEGERIIKYKSGQLSEKRHYEQGLLHGKQEEWYENGQLSLQENYFHDSIDGTQTYWNKDGKIHSRKNYLKSIPHGREEYYFDNGNLRSLFQFKNGLLDGTQLEYHISGQILKEENYINGTKNGLQRYFSKKGIILGQVNLVNGNGVLHINYENGKLKKEEHYKNGVLEGLYRTWKVNGDIETNGVFENGEFKTKNYYYDISQLNFENTIDYNELKESKVDSCFYFTRNARNYKFTGLAINEMGKLKTEFNFREGKLHGKNFVYHRKQKTLECNYINGKMHGENLSWCIDGHLQHKTLYDNGIQINEGFWWYCDGKTKIHQIFKNGEKISEKSYYPNGILRSEEDNNSNQHTYIEYYESGNIKSKSVSSFDNSQTQCWDELGSEVQCPE